MRIRLGPARKTKGAAKTAPALDRCQVACMSHCRHSCSAPPIRSPHVSQQRSCGRRHPHGSRSVALALANSPLSHTYFGILGTYIAGLSILHWINDALMALFFLLVGLEIKREFIDGQLSTWPRRILRGVGAQGAWWHLP